MKTTSLRTILFRLTGQLVYIMTGQRNYTKGLVGYAWGFAILLAFSLIAMLVYIGNRLGTANLKQVGYYILSLLISYGIGRLVRRHSTR